MERGTNRTDKDGWRNEKGQGLEDMRERGKEKPK